MNTLKGEHFVKLVAEEEIRFKILDLKMEKEYRTPQSREQFLADSQQGNRDLNPTSTRN